MTTEATEPIDPSTTALLIMDYQNGIIPMAPNPEELLAGAREAIDLIRSHGGTIGYKSTVGRGTVVTIKLPCSPAAAPELAGRAAIAEARA